MAQSALNISLPPIILGSSAPDSSTGSPGIADISDAVAIAGFVNGTTTAPGLILQVNFTTDTGGFVNLNYPSSAMGLVNITSAYFIIPSLGAKQIMLASTVATRATTVAMTWVKQVYV